MRAHEILSDDWDPGSGISDQGSEIRDPGSAVQTTESPSDQDRRGGRRAGVERCDERGIVAVRDGDGDMRRAFGRRSQHEHRGANVKDIEGRRLHGDVHLEVNRAVVVRCFERDPVMCRVRRGVSGEVCVDRRWMMVVGILVHVRVQKWRAQRPDRHAKRHDPRQQATASHSVAFYTARAEAILKSS
jgi:hypothetical protein